MAATAPHAKPIGERTKITDFEKAQEVLSAFYRLQPQLSSIARALTDREDIHVMPSAGGTYTDNKRIFLSLTPDMIIDGEHDRRMCGKRDGHGLMICEMCRKYEALIVPLYHEMGHIIFGSFEATSGERLGSLLDDFFEKNVLGLPENRIRAVKRRLSKSTPGTYIEAANYVSPFMPPLLNAMEDSRVNAGIIRRNPGAGKMFRADVAHIMSGGVVNAVGDKSMWYDQPENAQFTIGCFLIASRIGVEVGWLSERVTDDLRDVTLRSMLRSIPSGNSAGDVFEATLPILERGRELGYFIHETDVEPEPGEYGESGDTDLDGEESDEFDSGMSGSGGSSSDSEGTDDGDSEGSSGAGTEDDDEADDDDVEGGGADDDAADESEEDDADDEPDGASGPDGDEGDPSDTTDGGDDKASDRDAEADGKRDGDTKKPASGSPSDVSELFDAFNPHEDDFEHGDHDDPGDKDKNVERALAQEDFDTTSSGLFGLDLRGPKDDDFDAAQRGGSTALVADKAIVQRGLGPLRVAFSENRQSSYDRNRRSGRVNAKVLARRVPFDDGRVFRKKRVPGKRDYHVVIGLDISGSTGNYSHMSGMTYLDMIKTCALLQAEMLAQVGVDFEVYAHTGGIGKGKARSRSYYSGEFSLNIFKLKDINEPWTHHTRERVQKLSGGLANLDGHTLEFYRKRLDESDKTDRLIIYYTDGAMPAENYSEELSILQRECRTISQRNYDVLAVAIHNNDPQKYGLDTVRVDTPEDMQKVVLELQRRLR